MLVFQYRKARKVSDIRKQCCNYAKIGTVSFHYRIMGPKDTDGMANSVDPYQTAPRVYTVCPDLSDRKLRIITGVFIFFTIYFIP